MKTVASGQLPVASSPSAVGPRLSASKKSLAVTILVFLFVLVHASATAQDTPKTPVKTNKQNEPVGVAVPSSTPAPSGQQAPSAPAAPGAQRGARQHIAQESQQRTQVQWAASPLIVLKGGKLLTVTHGVIENGVIVMQNGKITAVGGPGTAVPPGARVVDVTGMTVYPGLIDAETHLGLTEISSEQMTNDLVEPSDEIMPHMHVYDAFHAETELIPVTRINGVTNAVVAPAQGDTLPGQDSFIQLAGRNRDEMIIGRDIALPMNVSGEQRRRGGGGPGAAGGIPSRFPSTRMGIVSQLRQTFLDAQEYAARLGESQRRGGANASGGEIRGGGSDEAQQGGQGAASGTGSRPFKRDLKLEALIPYLQGKKPVVLAAHQADEVLTAVELAREFNLHIILDHVDKAENIVDQIAAYHVPVIVGPIWTFPGDEERYDSVFKIPAELAKRGVKIAFATYTDDHNARNLPYQAGYAVAYGLPPDEALKAVTLNPAEMFGVADQLGSLDVGKTANVVVANGDPLDVKTDVKHVFIEGNEIALESKQTRLRDEYWPK